MSRSTQSIWLAAVAGGLLAVAGRGRLARAPQALATLVEKRRRRLPRGVEEYPRQWVDTIGTPLSDGPHHGPGPEVTGIPGDDRRQD